MTGDCRGYKTPSLRGIPLASRCGNAALTRGKLRIPQRPMLVSFLNNLYDQCCVRVTALGRHSAISMFHLKNVGGISSACISNGMRGRPQFERPGRDSKQKGDAHQQNIFPSGRNGSVGVDVLRESRQRHPSRGLLRARRQFNASCSISPFDCCFTVSSRSVGLLF